MTNDLVKIFKYIKSSNFSKEEKELLFSTFLLMNEDEILVIVRSIDKNDAILKKFNNILKHINNSDENIVPKEEQEMLIESIIED